MRRRTPAAPEPAAQGEVVLFRGAALEVVMVGDWPAHARVRAIAIGALGDLMVAGPDRQARDEASAALDCLGGRRRRRARRAV